jgi:hypothetical protein
VHCATSSQLQVSRSALSRFCACIGTAALILEALLLNSNPKRHGCEKVNKHVKETD